MTEAPIRLGRAMRRLFKALRGLKAVTMSLDDDELRISFSFNSDDAMRACGRTFDLPEPVRIDLREGRCFYSAGADADRLRVQISGPTHTADNAPDLIKVDGAISALEKIFPEDAPADTPPTAKSGTPTE